MRGGKHQIATLCKVTLPKSTSNPFQPNSACGEDQTRPILRSRLVEPKVGKGLLVLSAPPLEHRKRIAGTKSKKQIMGSVERISAGCCKAQCTICVYIFDPLH